MSWFSELAGKAEAFLDRVDQATASTLQDAGIVKNSPGSNPPPTGRSTLSSTNDPSSLTGTAVAQSLSYEPTAAAAARRSSIERSQGATVAQILVGSASESPLLSKSKGGPLSSTLSSTAIDHSRKDPSATSVDSGGMTRTLSSSSVPSIGSKTGLKSRMAVEGGGDDMLFEFLNTPSSSSRVRTAKTLRSTPKIKPSSSASSLNFDRQQLSSLPGPLLSPVKAQPLVGSLETGNEGARSQWDVGEIMIKETSQEEFPGKGKDDTNSATTIGAKPEETDGSTEARVSPSSPRSENGDTEPLTCKSERSAEQQSSDVSESQPAPSDDCSDGPNQPQNNNTDQTLLVEIDSLRQRVSNFELENKLLKREIGSLNDEMGTLITRLNESSDSSSHYEREIQSLREQVSQSDHVIRQLRSHDDDLQALLEARDQQIAVLRAQLTEGDRTAEQLRVHVSAAQREKEQLLQDANLSSDAQNQALESLKSKLTETETLLREERERKESARWESAQRESQLEAEKMQLSEALASQQKQLGFQQMKMAECQSSLRNAQSEGQAVRKEFEEYKQRAAGILQAKEKLICSLQSGGGGAAASAVSEAQLEEMRLEKEYVQAQLHSAQQQIESCRITMQEMEDRYHGEVDGLSEQLRVCESILEEEKRQHTVAKQEIARLNQELEVSRDDWHQEKATIFEQVKEKDAELASVNAKLLSSSPDKAELESRLRELTESLIQKQTTLETLNSERHSLNLQMQRMQVQLSDAQRVQAHKSETAVVMNGIEPSSNDTSRIRPISSVLSSLDDAPTESRLHNVKRAVNTVDRFSIRLGVFLRRYPHARLFALLYVVLLHIWVMIVLLTYTPEVHSPEHL